MFNRSPWGYLQWRMSLYDAMQQNPARNTEPFNGSGTPGLFSEPPPYNPPPIPLPPLPYSTDPNSVNCLGYALQQPSVVYPNYRNNGNSTLNSIMSKFGYSCTSGISSSDCQAHCANKGSVMVYVYVPIPKDRIMVRGFNPYIYVENVRNKYPNDDFFNTDWNKYRPDDLLDYHAMRGIGNGCYAGQPQLAGKNSSNDKTGDPNIFSPSHKNPEYIPTPAILSQSCCCN